MSDDDGVERHAVRDRDGDLWATASYHDTDDPSTRFDSWVIDFGNGDRLTGQPANVWAKWAMNNDALSGEMSGDWPYYADQAETVLSSLAYDPDADAWSLDVRGVRVWFRDAKDEGDDVVLYQTDRGRAGDGIRAGKVDDAPFSAHRLKNEMQLTMRDRPGSV